jgi:hypothetical protein
MDWRISLPNNEFGDFQTPAELARRIVELLGTSHWDRVLEPTCGTGHFLEASSALHPREMLGLERQKKYAERARRFAPVVQEDIFEIDLGRDLPWNDQTGSLLVVGNPPWVTNSQLSQLGSTNVPEKRNIRHLRGIDAMTGSSNFDIAEYIWLKLITDLHRQEPTIALLCKTIVARNVLSYAAQHKLPIGDAALYVIDAKEWFGVSVDACLFVVTLRQGTENYTCRCYPSLYATVDDRTIGVVDGRMVSDTVAYEETRCIDGVSPVEWRQGIKHDASGVMELLFDGRSLRTKTGEELNLESECIYPMLKGTDVFRGRTVASERRMLVPHRSLQDDPSELASRAPAVWSYLTRNGSTMDGRKSSIYRNRSRFSIFGVGEYSFAPFKVAVSGLHKEARFRAVGPIGDTPVVFDDTCYFIPAASALQAVGLSAALNSSTCQRAIESIAFWDAKRPITKKLLQRIDLLAVARGTRRAELQALAEAAMEQELHLPVPGAKVLVGLDEVLAEWNARTAVVPEAPKSPALQGAFII